MGQVEDDRFDLLLRTDGEVVIVELRGELDLLTAPRVADQFQALADCGLTEVVVDATRLTFIDAAGVRSLWEGRAAVHREGSHFFVVPSPLIRRVLDILALDPVLVTLSSVEEALGELDREK